MIRTRGQRLNHKAFFEKDYCLDLPGPISIPAAAITRIDPNFLNVRGFKTFTLMLTVPATSVINGTEMGIAVRGRPEDSSGTYYYYLPLKTALALADFRANIFQPALVDYTIAFGGNALNYTGYSFSNFVPYFYTTNDAFSITYLAVSCIT